MSATEQIYELLIQANPVPELDSVPQTARVDASDLRVLDPRRNPMQTQERVKPVDQAPPRKRWIPALAAAAVVIVFIGAIALLFDGSGSDETPVVDTPAPETDTATERETAAVAAAERFLAAINSGDLDTIVALAEPDEADLRMWEMNAELATEHPIDVRGCVAAIATDELVRVECDVVMSDPVFVALGADELVMPWQVYDDGLVEWRPFEGADPIEINEAYRDYLRLFDLEAYSEMCDPSRHAFGTVNFAGGIAFTAECGELQRAVAEDVAAWIEAGRPES